MEKQVVEEAEKEGRSLPSGEIKLPMFKELQAKKRAEAEKKFLEERAELEKNVSDIDKQILEIQKALRDIDGVQTIDSFFRPNTDKSEKKPIEVDKGKKRKSSGDSDDGGEEKPLAQLALVASSLNSLTIMEKRNQTKTRRLLPCSANVRGRR